MAVAKGFEETKVKIVELSVKYTYMLLQEINN